MMERKMGYMSQLDSERRKITEMVSEVDRREMRDKLVMAAFQALLSNVALEPAKTAKAAYEYADAMLLEWEKRR
jgi:hypothetical protein